MLSEHNAIDDLPLVEADKLKPIKLTPPNGGHFIALGEVPEGDSTRLVYFVEATVSLSPEVSS